MESGECRTLVHSYGDWVVDVECLGSVCWIDGGLDWSVEHGLMFSTSI